MRSLKKVLNVFFLIVLIINLGGCIEPKKEKYEEGDFIYRMDKNTKTAVVMSISEVGKEKRSLIIPQYVRGYEVIGFGYNGNYDYEHYDRFESDNLENLYIMSTYELFNAKLGSGWDFKGIKNISNLYIFTMRMVGMISLFGNSNVVTYYITNEKYVELQDSEDTILRIANLEYDLNYEEALNSRIYFIDNVKDETIELIPPDPTREGYIFDGWYKESECINKWDFSNDVVPYDKENQIITELFAKWS